MMPVIWQLKALTKNYKYHTSPQHLYLYNKCHSIKNYERLYKFQLIKTLNHVYKTFQFCKNLTINQEYKKTISCTLNIKKKPS